MDIFRKMEVNIPLFEPIKQIPRYAKLLKELYVKKKKLKGNKTIQVTKKYFFQYEKKKITSRV